MLPFKYVVQMCVLGALSLTGAASAIAETVKFTLVNGDVVSGELLESESTDDVRVLISPVLGRLEIDVASIKVPEPDPLWKSSISGGFNGNDSDGDGSFSGNISASTRYKDADQIFVLSGGINYSRNDDKDKDPEIKTKKGNLSLSYDRFVSSNITAYTLTNYNYDYLKDSGVNDFVASVGVGFPLIKSDTTTLSIKTGPSLEWIGGGNDCSSNEYCGNSYGGAFFGVDFGWKPTPWFHFGVANQFRANFASEVKPSNSFAATFKFIPSTQTNLFTSLKFQSTYQSMSTPASNNTVSGQIGVDF